MFRLYIFDVKHGDSLLIETPEGKIGIIDCNKKDDTIPLLEFIKHKQPKDIEFICLTHPHLDHYNGLLEVFEYCRVNNIRIRYFIDSGISPKEMDMEFYNVLDADYFAELYLFIKNMVENDPSFIRKCQNKDILYREHEFVIRGLAPFEGIIRQIIRDKYKYPERELNERFNHFSIVLSVESPSYILMLLADTELKESKIILQNNRAFKKKIDLFKISHHGSEKNYYNQLVTSLANKKECHAVISSGCKYNTPSEKVIHSLSRENLATYCTNYWDVLCSDDVDNPIPGLSTELDNALFALTNKDQEWEKLMPYHGDIVVDFNINNIEIRTETSRPPLT